MKLGVEEDALDDYQSPPPLYKPIQGAIALENGILNNLMTGFVCMKSSENAYGDVVVMDSLRLWGGSG